LGFGGLEKRRVLYSVVGFGEVPFSWREGTLSFHEERSGKNLRAGAVWYNQKGFSFSF
jgi:hypothetical protein